MKTSDIFLGTAAGAAAGLLVKEIYSRQDAKYAAERVLKDVKNAFKAEGPIDGSWIVMNPEPYKQYAVETDVYRGGITRHSDGELEQFEFLADAYTGAVLNVKKV
ncbi:PepSY domain-containing protein [Planococcus lenghuensis]|uniref:Peptidase M4 n=1 Tax=Planococcus lenghuensis TaxID=2213202 RepID=A0A1Q2KXE2_9BACL|nr:PepSY domain-containing protein [Planococcus lenghuensis]AQQ52774.1 peptidase M4 [Planococcus lenghuensis]